jgi:hypothetical protein
MTQAWDFVDDAVLWQRRNAFLTVVLGDIDLGPQVGMRFWSAITNENTWRAEKKQPPIVTVSDLIAAVTVAQLMRTPNVGAQTIGALQSLLDSHGLRLRDE